MTSTNQTAHVIVLGAGYAGVMATNRLLSRLDQLGQPGRVEVTVINPRPEFVQRIRLHQLATSSATVTAPLADLLHPRARLQVGAATRIDPEAQVVLADGRELSYDKLIYAVGSRTALTVPGSSIHAHQIGDLEGALATRGALAELGRGARVVVVGGGLTGVETAAELAERRPDLVVTLLASRPLGSALSPRGRTLLGRTLERLGVVVSEGVEVTRVEARRVHTADGRSWHHDLCLWAASLSAPSLAADSDLAVDARGRLLVDSTLRHPEFNQIVGAGDSVAPPAEVAGHLRMSCAAALPLGAHAAQTVLADLGADPSGGGELSIGFVLQCLSLGRRAALVQAVAPDDTPRSLAFSGWLAVITKEQISRYTFDVLSRERTRSGSYRTPSGPRPGTLAQMSQHATPCPSGEQS